MIWHAVAPDRLTERVFDALDDSANQVLVRAIVVWEIALKRPLGKLLVPESAVDELLDARAVALPISLEHAAAVEHLPHHHRDPFDRLLVAQAQVEGATIVSADDRLREYDVPVLWD